VSEPFLGQIQAFGFNFAPRGWALCNGQLMSIAQNTALFSLLGTTFGGDGVTTFGLPDLRSRVGIHMGQGPGLSPYVIGEISGTENVTLNVAQMPQHSHSVMATSGSATTGRPAGAVPARDSSNAYDAAPDGQTTMNAGMIGPSGQSLPHQNLQPFLVLNFCIALQGIFPSRN
jgi:microcystin-dependent protein